MIDNGNADLLFAILEVMKRRENIHRTIIRKRFLREIKSEKKVDILDDFSFN